MIPKIDDCKPGLAPVGYTVLVALDAIEEKIGSIIIPEKTKNRENGSSERGRLVAVSDMAFKGGDWGGVDTPSVGEIVLFQRHAGAMFEGDDGKDYRIVQDQDLRGVFK